MDIMQIYICRKCWKAWLSDDGYNSAKQAEHTEKHHSQSSDPHQLEYYELEDYPKSISITKVHKR